MNIAKEVLDVEDTDQDDPKLIKIFQLINSISAQEAIVLSIENLEEIMQPYFSLLEKPVGDRHIDQIYFTEVNLLKIRKSKKKNLIRTESFIFEFDEASFVTRRNSNLLLSSFLFY